MAHFIGTNFVAKAPADGYTLLYVPSSFSFAQLVIKSTGGYDARNDFTAIIEVGESPMFLVTGGSTGFKSFQDVTAAAKTRKMELQRYGLDTSYRR